MEYIINAISNADEDAAAERVADLRGNRPEVAAEELSFEDWLQSTNSTRPELENYYKNYLIPDVDLSFKNFPQFIAEREKLIMQRLAELLEVKLIDSD